MEQNAWQVVLDELMKVSLFCGKYDARNNSDPAFMYGIGTVMENIAWHVSEDCAYKFNEIFTTNLVGSQEVAKCD